MFTGLMSFIDPGCCCMRGTLGPVCALCESELTPIPVGQSVYSQAIEPHWLASAKAPSTRAGCAAIFSAFELDTTALRFVRAFKYSGEKRLGSWMAKKMLAHVPQNITTICWVPTTAERRRKRGYDQAEVLARQLARLSGTQLIPALVRSKNDSRQTGLRRQDRLAGPALSIKRASVRHFELPNTRHFLIVDDVTTTGASLNTAAKCLGLLGVNQAFGLSFAITP